VQLTSPQEYQVVFDAVQAGFSPVRVMIPGIILALVGVMLAIAAFRLGSRRAKVIATAVALVMICYGAVWSGMVYRQNAEAYGELRAALEQGRYTRVEGVVTDFQREPRGGRRPERWTVAGHTYELSSFRLPRTPLIPGTVKEGMWVRIADVNGQIARLEIRR
jgi:hypothetical protein